MVLVGATFAVDFVEKNEDITDGKIFAFVREEGEYKLWIAEPQKNFLEKFFGKIGKVVYGVAGEHNPKEDLFPDGVDNSIIDGFRNRIN